MALPLACLSGLGAERGEARARRVCWQVGIATCSQAKPEIRLGGETGLAYLPPAVRPFLGWAGSLDQGRSHVFSHIPGEFG